MAEEYEEEFVVALNLTRTTRGVTRGASNACVQIFLCNPNGNLVNNVNDSELSRRVVALL